MYRLVESGDFRTLARAFAARLEQSAPADPLEPARVVVPNRDTARWLTLFLAGESGVSANIEFLLPSEWAWNSIRRERPGLPQRLPSDPEPMSWALYSLLVRDKLPASLGNLSFWMENRGGGRRAEAARELSRRIASLFDQYQVYRPAMLQMWGEGAGRDDSAAARWQRTLWRELQKAWETLPESEYGNSRGELFLSFAEDVASGRSEAQGPLFLFNPGILPGPLHQLFWEHSRILELYHYRLTHLPSHPDGQTAVSGGAAGQLRTSLGGGQREESELIEEFRRRDPARLKRERIEEPGEPESLLAAIRQSIRTGAEPVAVEGIDDSVQIRSCHSPLREVESLYQFLLDRFSRQKELRPDEILVVAPDLERYRPCIEAVFGTVEEGLPRIPWTLPGSRTAGRLESVFLHLLSLPDSRFGKEELFEFLGHRAVRDRFGLNSADLSRIRRWFDENRVSWGWDDGHREEFGQPAGSVRTWRAALERGWRGQLSVDRPGNFSGDLLLYSGILTADERELWAVFHRILRQLNEIRQRVKKERDAAAWCGELRRWAELFLPEGPEWEEERLRIFQQIGETEEEMMLGFSASSSVVKMPFSIIVDTLAGKFDKSSAGSALFTEGVVFHSMVPVRSLPFRVVALLGMNEEDFPRKPPRDEFDLMASDRSAGERDQRREDRNLFLESIMAAGELFYCSYIGRSQRDDEKFPPSVILDEWIRTVASVTGASPEKVVRQESLNGFSPNCFSEGAPTSFSPGYLEVSRRLGDTDSPNGIVLDAPFEETGAGGRVEIDLHELERFFSDPPGAFFRQRFGMELRRVSRSGDEEFRLDELEHYLLFERVFAWIVRGREENWIEKVLGGSGMLPEGWPGERIAADLIRTARRAEQDLRRRGYDPEPVRRYVDLEAGGRRIRGELVSFSPSGHLELAPARFGGRKLLLWRIRSLIASMQGWVTPDCPSRHFSDFRKKEGALREFEFESGAEEELLKLIGLYEEGMVRPLMLYPESAWAYAEELENGEAGAVAGALRRWEGDVYGPDGEREAAAIELLEGRGADPDMDRIREVAESLYLPVIDKLRELS